jgi:hypothetical protein
MPRLKRAADVVSCLHARNATQEEGENMRHTWVFRLGLIALSSLALSAQAAIVPYDLQGKAGFGLLAGNQNTAINGTPGSGGEVGTGITLDTNTNALSINVAWGTANGFTNLTGPGIAGHIHGITTNPAPGSFLQDANVLIGLDSGPGWDPSATSGSIHQTVNLSAAQVTALNEGRLYVNVHTGANGGGEIRGNIVPAVPEPTALGGVALAITLLLQRRRHLA